jgi:hypothetical protein
MKVAASATPTTFTYRTTNAATTTTLWRVCIYDSSGAIIGYSSSSTTNVQAAANAKTETLTMSRALVAGENVYVGVLWVGTGTAPILAASPANPGLNDWMPGTASRAYTLASQTDLPASVTYSALTKDTQLRMFTVK